MNDTILLLPGRARSEHRTSGVPIIIFTAFLDSNLEILVKTIHG
jgi:hypothetical protein